MVPVLSREVGCREDETLKTKDAIKL